MGGASGSSAGGGVGGNSVDVTEASSLGMPEEDLVGSDISVEDCKSVILEWVCCSCPVESCRQ